MADRERRMTPPFGGVFVPSARVMNRDDMRRAIRRMAHEIIEKNQGQFLFKTDVSVEIKGESTPALVATWLVMQMVIK